MKKTLAIILLLASAGAVNHAAAQAAGNYLYNNPNSINNERATVNVNAPSGSTVNLKSEIMMNVRATSYTAIFAAAQSGRDVWEVDSLMNQRITMVKYGLALLGISEENIHIDAVSMVPTYAFQLEEKKFSKRSTEIPVGFEMKKNIHVLFKHHNLLDAIISQMAFADIYDMVKVEYNLDGSQTYFEELRKAALSAIHSKEATYNSLNLHLEVYSMGDGLNTTYPMERYKSFTAFHSGTTFQTVQAFAGSNTNSISVNGKNNTILIDGKSSRDALSQQFIIQNAEKNKTIFYDRMPYNQFDKVINADMEEPCIQLFYTMQVSYVMQTQEQFDQTKKNKEQAELNAQNMVNRKGKLRRRR